MSIYLSTYQLLCQYVVCFVNMWYVVFRCHAIISIHGHFEASYLGLTGGCVCNGKHEVLDHDVLDGGWMVGDGASMSL